MMGLCVDIVEVCGYLWIFMKVSLILQQFCKKVLYLFSVCSCCRRLVPGQCPHTDVKGEI